MRHFSLTLLGSGTSLGVPIIGCTCNTCISTDPKDKRTRTSAFIETSTSKILIDTATDLRHQLLANNICDIDHVLYTHHHSDHILGIEELRAISWRKNLPIPIHASKQTMSELTHMFHYIFEPKDTYKAIAKLTQVQFNYHQPFSIGDLTITPFPLIHGHVTVAGFKIGQLVYATDVNEIPSESWRYFAEDSILFLDALRLTTSPNHFSLDEAIKVVEKTKPLKCYLIHLSHAIKADISLPTGIELAYDGLQIDINY